MCFGVIAERRDGARTVKRRRDTGHHAVAPRDPCNVGSPLAHLGSHPPRVIVRREEPYERVHEHERGHPIWVRRSEGYRDGCPVPVRQDCDPFRADRLEHGDQVAYRLLEPWAEVATGIDVQKWVRQSGATAVNQHDACERRQTAVEPLGHRKIPESLDRLCPTGNVDEVNQAVTEGLVRDQAAVALDVLHFGSAEHVAKS